VPKSFGTFLVLHSILLHSILDRFGITSPANPMTAIMALTRSNREFGRNRSVKPRTGIVEDHDTWAGIIKVTNNPDTMNTIETSLLRGHQTSTYQVRMTNTEARIRAINPAIQRYPAMLKSAENFVRTALAHISHPAAASNVKIIPIMDIAFRMFSS
jgi:hypothetical protein